jgi:hypothetical protein
MKVNIIEERVHQEIECVEGHIQQTGEIPDRGTLFPKN